MVYMYKRLKNPLFLTIIILLAAFFRFYRLGYLDLIPDEGHYAYDAFEYFSGNPGVVPRFHTQFHYVGQMGHPFLGEWLMVIAYKISGPSVFSARLISALAGIATTIIIFLISKLIFRREATALISSFIYAALPLAVKYDRTTYADSLQTFLMASFLFFYIKCLRSSKSIIPTLILGMITALILLTKLSAILIFGFLLIQFIANNIKDKFRIGFKNILTFFFSFSITFLLGTNPKAYLMGIISPTDQNLAINSLWLNISTITQNLFSKSFFTLIPLPLIVFVFLGIIKVIKQKKYLLLLIYFFSWSPLLFQLLTNEGTIYRILPLMFIGIFFAAIYLDQLIFYKKIIFLTILITWSLYASLKWGLLETFSLTPIDHEVMNTINSLNIPPDNQVYLYEVPRNYFFWKNKINFIIDENFLDKSISQKSICCVISTNENEKDNKFNQELLDNNFRLIKEINNTERSLLVFYK